VKLKQAFEDHLEQTRGHVERLEPAFDMLDDKAKREPCEAMKGLVKKGSRFHAFFEADGSADWWRPNCIRGSRELTLHSNVKWQVSLILTE